LDRLMKKTLFAILLLVGSFLAPRQADAALLYTGAANQVVYLGESFVVEWYLDTQGQDVNSMSLVLNYAKDKLEVLEASAGSSALDLWIKPPEFDNGQGAIRLIGGVSGGVDDAKLPIFRATFKPLVAGDAKLSLGTESEVLVADGLGSSAGVIFNEVNFRINPAEAKPAQISSATHPNPDAWYKENDVEIAVQAKPGEEYSYTFSSNLEMFPDPNPDDVRAPVRFMRLDDGIYYFKLNSRASGGDWQEAGVFRVKVDSTPPRDFTPAVGKDPAVFDGAPFISFSTSDSVSGVQYYEVKSSFLSGWQKTDNTFYKLPGLVLGDTIEVKVVDAAGNERITAVKVDKALVNPAFSNPIFWVIISISLLAAALLAWQYARLMRKYKINDK
jgi:hypothetical protein